MRRRVGEARVAHLATVAADGRPHLVPCCFVLASTRQGEVIWSAVDAKPKSTLALARLANVRANPVAALMVDHYADEWSQLWWVRVDAGARVIDDGPERDEAICELTAKYRQYRRSPPPGPVLALDPGRWTAWP